MSPEQFLELANALPEAMFLAAGDGRLLAANRAVAKRLGYRPDALTGEPLGALVAETPEAVTEFLHAASRNREPVPGLLHFRTPQGEVVPCRVEGSVVRPRTATEPAQVVLRCIPRSETPSQFAILNLRIGELTREMARRKRAEEQVREREEWLRVTLASIGDAVIATDLDGKVLMMNAVAEQLTAWRQAEAAGQPLEAVFRIVNEATREPVESPVTQVLREGCIVGLANHTVLIAKDGTEWAIDDSGAPILNDSGELLGVVLVFREVTERRRMEAALRQQAAELVEADRRKNEFLAMLAHELRNPLAPILNSAHLLQAPRLEEATLRRQREIIERQTRHLSRLVDDLLEVSRISRGLITVRRDRVDLRMAVEQAIETVQPHVEARRHALESWSAPDPVWVVGDGQRLAQVVSNLLHNAAKYTAPGGRIGVAVGSEDATASIRVWDTGKGIAPALLPHVFDLFRQGDRSLARTEGGLGIGLSMVKMLVDLHGGTVEARSEGAGRGSEFVVRLPAVDAALPPESGSVVRPEAAPAGLRVLLVEDNVDAATTLATLLELWGHEVRVLHSGAGAVQAAQEFGPHVAILDLGLPGRDGYDVARQLRAAACLEPGCVLIAMTGYGEEADRRRTEAAGFSYHLTKPVEPAVVEALLRQLAARRGTSPTEEAG